VSFRLTEDLELAIDCPQFFAIRQCTEQVAGAGRAFRQPLEHGVTCYMAINGRNVVAARKLLSSRDGYRSDFSVLRAAREFFRPLRLVAPKCCFEINGRSQTGSSMAG
jgi:hypothetical protein